MGKHSHAHDSDRNGARAHDSSRPTELDGLDVPALLRAGGLRAALQIIERAFIVWALDRHGGNVSASARRLVVGRATLNRKVVAHQLRSHTSRQRGRPPAE